MSVLNLYPRENIIHAPTPIEAMTNLSKQLNCNIFIKRDDCTGLAGGGNKARKLEYLIAAAKAEGADTLITLGGIQSNHARQTAAAAAKFGFDCHLILEDVSGTPKQDYYTNGNVLLDKLLGASLHQVKENQDAISVATGLKEELIQQGKKPYFIPMGGSNEIGSLGYAQCATEIIKQISDQNIKVDHIVVATGSAGTQAGLLTGLIANKVNIPVLGICVSRDAKEQIELVENLLENTLTMLGLDPVLAQGKVCANGDYYGDGYGIVTDEMLEAVKLTAQLEGVLLDPVYTGKGMSGLIDLCRKQHFTKEQNILFIHTGGSQGLFAYQEAF